MYTFFVEKEKENVRNSNPFLSYYFYFHFILSNF